MKPLTISLFVICFSWGGVASSHEGHGTKKSSESRPATLEGEILDMACYAAHEGKGKKHADCAKQCALRGSPIGLLTKDGTAILLVDDHDKRKPYEQAKRLAGEEARVSGTLILRGGLPALIVESAVNAATGSSPAVETAEASPAASQTKWYLLHPIAVHFPIVLLILGFAASCLSLRRRDLPGLGQAQSWLLWLGAATAWAAMGLGLLAAKTAPHVPAAWEDVIDHRNLAFWTVGLSTLLSLWRWRAPERHPKVFLAAWLIAVIVLLATAYEGGQIVYTFGMGVAGISSP